MEEDDIYLDGRRWYGGAGRSSYLQGCFLFS